MYHLNVFAPLDATWVLVIVATLIWELIWKLISLWKSAKNNQILWFVCIGIFTTAGILPILYLLIHKKK